MPNRPRPLVLCILDGWGERADRADNAILLAKTPNWDRFMARCPHAHMQASELFVGLPERPDGQFRGRPHESRRRPRRDAGPAAHRQGDRRRHARRRTRRSPHFIAALKKSGGTAHLMGLLSPGGVHSHQDHIAALAQLPRRAGVPVAIHAFLDGRDTPPQERAGLSRQVPRRHGRLASDRASPPSAAAITRWTATSAGTGSSRPIARWSLGEGETAPRRRGRDRRNPTPQDKTDEFVLPTVIGGYRGMKDGDGVLMANFRADRVREILAALLDPDFDGFARPRIVALRRGGRHEPNIRPRSTPSCTTLFPPEDLRDTFGEVVSRAGLKQLRIAETEKYAHVTFFFNGGREEEFPGESRILVPSPKVATYDLQARDVGARGDRQAGRGDRAPAASTSSSSTSPIPTWSAIPAISPPRSRRSRRSIDCLGRLAAAVTQAGGAMLVTADHGNAEMMRDPATGEPHTAHTLNPVPLLLVNPPPGVAGIARRQARRHRADPAGAPGPRAAARDDRPFAAPRRASVRRPDAAPPVMPLLLAAARRAAPAGAPAELAGSAARRAARRPCRAQAIDPTPRAGGRRGHSAAPTALDAELAQLPTTRSTTRRRPRRRMSAGAEPLEAQARRARRRRARAARCARRATASAEAKLLMALAPAGVAAPKRAAHGPTRLAGAWCERALRASRRVAAQSTANRQVDAGGRGLPRRGCRRIRRRSQRRRRSSRPRCGDGWRRRGCAQRSRAWISPARPAPSPSTQRPREPAGSRRLSRRGAHDCAG